MDWTEVIISYDNKGVFERDGPSILMTTQAFLWFNECLDMHDEWYVVHNPKAQNAAFTFLNRNDAVRFKLTWGGA